MGGAPERVETIAKRARQGSPAARVEHVAVSDDTPAETRAGFEQRATL